jgi:hypothetical protein
MSEEGTVGFDYAALVASALRGVVRDVLRKVADEGLVGEQHLYLSFRTSAPGLDLPAHLRKQFPKEMTIVLQNQFWGLAVEGDAFSVQLRFDGRLERLTVPFAALVAFADPSVPFGLRFEGSAEDAEATASEPASVRRPTVPAGRRAAPRRSESGEARVVAFRPARKKPGPERVDS